MSGGPLISFDPSSTCTGYAVFEDGRLVEVGWLRGSKRDAPAAIRIGEIADEAETLCRQVHPTTVVIEVPSGRPGKGLERGAKARLAIYGWAVGELRRACVHAVERNACESVPMGRVVCIDERMWTRGVNRAARVARVLDEHPAFAERLRAKDGGADACDAIGLGDWFMLEESTRAATRAAMQAVWCLNEEHTTHLPKTSRRRSRNR